MSDVARTSVNQAPGGGTDYPFSAPCGLEGGVLDAYLSYEDAACAHTLPFSLTVAGTVYSVEDADGVTVASADVASQGTSLAWGDRTVYEVVSSPWVLRLVVRTDLVGDGTGVLDTRTCNRLPARVRSFRVGTTRVSGNVKFESGYNVTLAGALPTSPTDGGRFASAVDVDAVPGAGAGRVPGCDDVQPLVRKINRVQPDCAGNFVIETVDCLRGQLPLFVSGDPDGPRTAEYSHDDLSQAEAASAIKLASDCRPCCDCDYFVRTYRGLKRMWELWRAAAARAEDVRDVYEDNRRRWMDSRQCRMDNPARLVSSTDYACKTFVGGSYCNFSTCCVKPVEIRFTLQRYKAGVLAAWGGGSVHNATVGGSPFEGDEPYAPVVAGPVVRFFVPFANPQAMSTAKMKFCANGCGNDESLRATMTVHVPQPDPNPDTGDPCEAAEQSVPSEISDIWAANDVPAGDAVRAVLVRTVALNNRQASYDCGC